MVNDLKQLLHDNVADAPTDHLDVASLVDAGHRRVRSRRTAALGGASALAAAAVVTAAALGGVGLGLGNQTASHRVQLAPVGPVLTLADARPAVEGQDFEVLATQTNENLDRANGTYFSGVTDDGLAVVVDGPHTIRNTSRIGLLDPATGQEDWLPGRHQVERFLAADSDRLVFQAEYGGVPGVEVFDRASRTWGKVSWPTLPTGRDASDGFGEVRVDDGRAWITVPHEGSWERFDLWSASLTDPTDVRDEHQLVGDALAEDGLLTWTTKRNEPNDGLHVLDPATGEAFVRDPQSGDRCNQLSLDRSASYVALGQYCGRPGGARDDRVQIVTATGDPVVTIQDDGVELTDVTDNGVVFRAYDGPKAGTYAYLFDSGDLVRISTAVSKFGVGGPTPGDYVLWDTPVNDRHGATQWLGRLL